MYCRVVAEVAQSIVFELRAVFVDDGDGYEGGIDFLGGVFEVEVGGNPTYQPSFEPRP